MDDVDKKKLSPIARDFMEFFSKEMGVKFIDVDTGEEIEVGETA